MKKFVIILAIVAAVSSEIFSPEQLKDILPFITGGSQAARGQFPYQVAVVTRNATTIQFCGGTLIKHKWVLTAASCFKMKFINILVVFGSVDLLKDEPVFLYNSTTSSSIIIHPDYNSYTNVNNIALIKIDEMPANIADHKNVAYLRIPTEDEAKTNLTGRDIVISGYGLIRDVLYLDLIMHHTTVKLTSNDVCRNFVIDQGGFNVTDSSLCIDTTGGKSSCGDDGGPMTIEIGSKKVLVGVIGIGSFPCTIGNPVIAENVFYHREWIEEKTSGSSKVAMSFSIFAAVVMMAVRNSV